MIVTVTLNPAVDQTLELSGSLAPETVTRVENARFDPGGKGINVSKYLTEMGVETVATGVTGGFLGDFIDETLADAGIETQFVDIDALTRMNSTIHTDSGEYKLNQSGPTVDSADIDELVDILDVLRPDICVVAGSLPPGLDSSAIDRLAEAGPWDTAVDVDGHVLRELSATYQWCKPNAPELEAATGHEITSVDDAKAAATALRRQGFERVVASLGADGAVLVGEETAIHEPAIDCDIVDTVGAGDALLAGFLGALSTGRDEPAALADGVAAAAAAVTTIGTTIPSLPTLRTPDTPS